MRTFKKLAAVALVAVALTTLSACGRSDSSDTTSAPDTVSDGPAKGDLTVWAMGAEGEALSKLTAQFEKENPDVHVTVTPVPWDSAHDKFTAAIAAGTAPDVAQIGTTWMGEFAGLKALDRVPSNFATSKFFEGANATNDVNGTAYGVPWYVETRVVYYRTDLAEKAGITEAPTTWKGLHDMAAAMQSKAGADWGITLQPGGTGSWQTVMPLIWSNGGDVVNSDLSKFTFDSPQSEEALAYYQSFFEDGIANKAPTAGTQEADFVSGKVPMFISGPWEIGALKQLGGDDFDGKYAVAPMPVKVTGTSFVGGANLGVFKNTKHRDAAWKLVKYLTEESTQAQWYKLVNDLPAVKASWNDDALKKNPMMAIFGKQLEDAKAPPAITTWDQVSAVFDDEVEVVVKTGANPKDALKTVQTEATSIGFGSK